MLKRALVKEAADWYAELCADEVSEAVLQTWQTWREQSADHQLAWQQVELLRGRLQDVPDRVSAVVIRNLCPLSQP